MQTVVVATHNTHKVTEIQAIVRVSQWQLVTLDAAGVHQAAVEDADSFIGNALIKARFAHQQTGLAALADDSGLVVDALSGAPGIYSSRYAGAHASDAENLRKLLDEMSDIPDDQRAARFVCAAAFVDTDGSEQVAVAALEGRIARVPSGKGGFGYDPVFVPQCSDSERTLAEYDAREKDAISHRFKALTALLEKLSGGSASAPPPAVAHRAQPVRIAAFDLDGTLLDASSPVRLVLRLTKDRIMSVPASVRVAAWGVHYKMGSEMDQSLPRGYVFRSLKHVSASDADAIMRNLYYEELCRFLRPQLLDELARHRREGRQILLTSASFAPIVRVAADDLGADGFIATHMEVKDGCYTGKTICEPPEGAQKLIQFQAYANEHYGANKWVLEWAYGDHFSDVPLLETASHAVAVDPERRLERIAKTRGWALIR